LNAALASLRRRLVDKLHGHPNRDMLVKRGLKLGHNVFLGHGVYIDPGHCWLIEIGDDSEITLNTTILAHDGLLRRRLGYSRIARVKIGREVFVGCGSIILPGVTIGDGAAVGAGSVVTSDVPPRTLVAGNPAKAIASIDDYLAKHTELMRDRPRWSYEGWTIPGKISSENKQIQWEWLAGGDGYVE
jgi:maltose O-acetyltransferase